VCNVSVARTQGWQVSDLGADKWVDSVESFIESCNVIARRK